MRLVIMMFFMLLATLSWSNTQQFTLDNGFKIIVKEDHRAPVAMTMIWYKVGSADEPGGITGVSHMLEHLMFKGTPKHPPGDFSKRIAALGGQENAFTNTDYTAYFEKIAATHLDTALKLEADRMQHLLFDPSEFKKELKVVQEERRMRTDDNPQALTLERFLATAHLASPYHHPVIGWMSDLEQMRVQDASQWYERYYAPDNATLVVVGDVKPKAVRELAKRYFGSIPSQKPQPQKHHVEPPRLGKKTVAVHAPAQVPMLLSGYTVPSVKTLDPQHPYEPYALELIAGILDAGQNGRLTKNLVRGQQVASSADASYNLYARYQTQFMLYGVPSQTHSIQNLNEAFQSEIKRLKETPVSMAELKRIKTQIIAQKTFERDSLFGQAMELGLLETIGLGWQASETYIDNIKRITPEQLQATATRYFIKKNLTQAELIPDNHASKQQ